MGAITSEQLVAYHPLVHPLAKQYTGACGAEYDDLYQEGMEFVLRTLMKGRLVSSFLVEATMRKWVLKCRLKGMTYVPKEEQDAMMYEVLSTEL